MRSIIWLTLAGFMASFGAAAAQGGTPQINEECSRQADARGLSGSARLEFRTKCKTEASSSASGPSGAAAPKSPSQAATTDKLHVIANTAPPDAFVSLRTDPSSRLGQRITTMPNGTVVKVLQQNPDGWWKVRVISTGQEGWALSSQNGKTWIACCAPSNASAPTAAAPKPVQQSQHGVASSAKDAKDAIAAGLPSEVRDKLTLRGGVIYEGYALQNWSADPIGGVSLLKYDAAKTEWTVLDTDGGGLDVESLISKGVPLKVAAELVSRLEFANYKVEVACKAGGYGPYEAIRSVILPNSVDRQLFLDSQRIEKMLNHISAYSRRYCESEVKAGRILGANDFSKLRAHCAARSRICIQWNHVITSAATKRVSRTRRSASEPGPTRDGSRISSAPRRKCGALHSIRETPIRSLDSEQFATNRSCE